MRAFPNVSIIGTGALGSALSRSFSEKGIRVYSLFNRSAASRDILSSIVEPVYSDAFPKKSSQLGKLVFITVSDDQIETIANRLAELSPSYENSFFVHCSGNQSSEVLKPLAAHGAKVASFHPLQTVTTHSDATVFEGVYFDIQGDREAVSLLGAIAERLGAEWFEISAGAKPYLHAAAVMASNYLISLLKTSSDIAEMGDIDPALARMALLPLVQHTLKNATHKELPEALTGPIARGDINTVEQHIKILDPYPGLLSLYKKMGSKALELADLDEPAAGSLLKLLDE